MKPQRTDARYLEIRDFLKRRLARESFGLSRVERVFLVTVYAAMIDRAYPCRRVYLGGRDNHPVFTPANSIWRKMTIVREYPLIDWKVA